MKGRKIRIIATTIASLLFLQAVQIAPLAEANPPAEPEEQSPRIVTELTAEREESAKHYLLSDGTMLAASYPFPVHYEEDGDWKDIDNTLVDDAAANGLDEYVTRAAPVRVKLSKKLKQGKTVSLDDGKVSLSWGFTGTSKNAAHKVENTPNRSAQEALEKGEVPALEKAVSETVYPEAYAGVDLQVFVRPDGVKENLILKNRNAKKSYEIEYRIGKLSAVQKDDKTIELKNGQDEVVYTISAPVMSDADGSVSDALTLAIAEQKNQKLTVRLTADETWLCAEGRDYPVIIDPTLESADFTDMQWVQLNQQSSGTGMVGGEVMVGTHNYAPMPLTYMGAWKVNNLPSIGTDGVIVKAEFRAEYYQGSGSLDLYEVLGGYDINNVSYSELESKIGIGNLPVDVDGIHENVGNGHTAIKFDITTIAQKNYYSGISIALKAKDTSTFYRFGRGGSGYAMPCIIVKYRNMRGFDERYPSHVQNMGLAGIVQINDATGHLAIQRSDLGFDGDKIAADIKMNYTLTDLDANDYTPPMKYSYGWRCSYFMRAVVSSVPNLGGQVFSYMVEDNNGRILYFTEQTEDGQTVYRDTEGLGYTLSIGSNRAVKYMESSSGDKVYFDSLYGRATKIESRNLNKGYIDIHYPPVDDGYSCIADITDGDGRKYQFTYDGSQRPTKLAYFGNGSTEIARVTYTHNSQGRLSAVTYDSAVSEGSETARYEYDTNGRLSKVIRQDGYSMCFTYAVGEDPKVIKMAEYGADGTPGDYIDIAYSVGKTTFTNAKGKKEIKIFDNYGNVMTTLDENGSAVFQKQASNGALMGSSGQKPLVINPLKNHSFENGTANWSLFYSGNTNYTAGIDASKQYAGKKSVKLTRSDAGLVEYNQDITGLDAGNYTFSVYMQTKDVTSSTSKGAGLLVELYEGNTCVLSKYSSFVTGTQSEWDRSAVSFTTTASTTKIRAYAGLMGNTVGTVWLDGMQLENHKSAQEYNLLENAGFENGQTGWSTTDTQSGDGAQDGQFRFSGKQNSLKAVTQTIPINGKKDDSFTFGAWAMASYCLPQAEDINRGRNFGIRIDAWVPNTNFKETIAFFPFNTYINSEWQCGAGCFSLPFDCDSIDFSLVYERQQGTVSFDNALLVDSQYYDTSANQSFVLPDKDTDTGAKGYTYDDFNRVTKYESPNGVVQNKTYRNNYSDEIVSTKETYNGVSIESTVSYEESGTQKTIRLMDPAGTAATEYKDKNSQVTKKSVDGKGNSTDFVYDALLQLRQASSKNAGGSEFAKNDYTYEHGQVKTVSHNGMIYTYNYNTFGKLSSIMVGDHPLISYEYEDNLDKNISKSVFGNGDELRYSYDENGNLTEVRDKNGTLLDEVCYDELGCAIWEKDYAKQILLVNKKNEVQEWSLDGSSLKRSYKKTEEGLSEKIGGAVFQTLTNTDGAMQTVTTGTIQTSTTVDKFGRTTQIQAKSGNRVLYTRTFSYSSSDGGSKTSRRVSGMTITAGGRTDEYDYNYDANGNIQSVYRNNQLYLGYNYDALDQLTGEFRFAESVQYENLYDQGGNLAQINQYTLGANYVPEFDRVIQTYTYRPSGWTDQLASCNGKSLTYDANGNVLSYDGRTYTWKNGRQLKQTAKDDTTVAFDYDAAGYRISKTVTVGSSHRTVSYQTIDGRITYEDSADGVTNYENYFYYDAANQPIGFRNVRRIASPSGGSAVECKYYTYVKNLQGDVEKILDDTGTVAAQYEYNAFGKLLRVLDGDANDVSGQPEHIANQNPIRYRGYYYDRETGYYYLQSRYYDPELQRFISADGYTDTRDGILATNMYAYCHNNPIKLIDPTGSKIESIDDLGFAILSGLGKAGEWDFDKHFKGQEIDGWGYGKIIDPWDYLKDRYGGNPTVARPQDRKVLDMPDFTMTEMHNYLNVNSDGRGDCCLVAITRIMLYYYNKGYTKIGKESGGGDITKNIYNRAFISNHNKLSVGPASADDAIRGTLKHYGYNNIDARNQYTGGFDKIKAEIDAGRPLIMNITVGTYENHSITIIGYELHKIYYSNNWINKWVDKPMLVVYDGWANAGDAYEEYFGWKDASGNPILSTCSGKERYVDFEALQKDTFYNITTLRFK